MGPFESLAMQLLAQCRELDSHIPQQEQDKSHTDPTIFDKYLLDGITGEAEKVRNSVIFTTQQLQDLASEPKELVERGIYTYGEMLALQAIYHYDLARKVPLDRPASFAEVAASAGISEGLVRRFLRQACLSHIFRQTDVDHVTHTAASLLIATNAGIRDEIGFATDDMAYAAAHEMRALDKYPDAENGALSEPNKCGFSIAYGTDLSIWGYMATTSDGSRRFASAMREMTSGAAFDARHLFAGYDWGELADRQATIVDVGGGQGTISRLLAEQFPGLKFVVQDKQEMIDVARTSLPEHQRDMVKLMEHDFFTPQTVTGDIYFLRWILHNWLDKYCVRILRSLVPALEKCRAKVVLYKYLMPEVMTPGDRFEYYKCMVDLTMLSNFAAQERTSSHFLALFKQADDRFRLNKVIEKEGSAVSILEFELVR